MNLPETTQTIDCRILWWGRFDKDYSRNRVLRQCMDNIGAEIYDFSPRISQLGALEADLKRLNLPTLIWVPCFRQRDLAAAVRWGNKKGIPVVFDPLISAYDKQVFERKKFSPESCQAKKILKWEQELLQSATLVFVDTLEHARFFKEIIGVDGSRIAVVPVGAEEEIFKPVTSSAEAEKPIIVLFYGSFLNLQAPEVIMDAACLYQGSPVIWKMVGQGPLLDECRRRAEGLDNVEFIPWVPYADLPGLIHSADILLGIFGTSAKASRVVPNKVYQSLACGKPLVTITSQAYPDNVKNNLQLGISWVEPGNAQQLADRVAELAARPEILPEIGRLARQTYETYFSMASISASLLRALQPLLPTLQKD